MERLKYDPVLKYLCVHNCIFHILSISGCEDSKHFLRCPINYHAIKTCSPEDNGTYKLLFRKPRTNECALPFVQLKVFSSEDTETVWNENKQMLKNGMPFIALVDVYYLHYRKEYQRLHGSHAVIVVDYYEEKDSVKIIDWYEPYFFIGLIKVNQFIMARSSENPKCANPFSGVPILNEWLYVFPNKYDVTKEDCLSENLSLSFVRSHNKEEIYGSSSIEYIIQSAEKNFCKEYFRELHENLFPLWRLYELLFSNIQEVICDYSCMLEYLDPLAEYKNRFQQLLFLILKLSIKDDGNLNKHFLQVLKAFYCSTKELYDILQVIYSLLNLNR